MAGDVGIVGEIQADAVAGATAQEARVGQAGPLRADAADKRGGVGGAVRRPRQRAGGREIHRAGVAGDRRFAGRRYRDPERLVGAHATEVGGLNQPAAGRVQLGHEDVGAAAIGRLERAGGRGEVARGRLVPGFTEAWSLLTLFAL